jgi:hypothetical protein
MGACDFRNGKVVEISVDPKIVFHDLVENAQWESGHGGYTGTIAEKNGFVTRHPHVFGSKKDALTFVEGDLDTNDKWGPAFHVMWDAGTGKRGHVFYGMASS